MTNRFSCLIEKPKKRRKHINFKVQIKQKQDINIFINFLSKDIEKRLKIDKKYYNDNNECHLKHLNFIIMEMLLTKVLILYKNNFDTINKNIQETNNDVLNELLYVPEQEYKKDLTIVERKDILERYNFIKSQKNMNIIAKEIYNKYKKFGFINLNFLKRKIYEYI